ncbi:uncharacterized protein BDZ99DRAFT_501134 [Mytilinidion resinicola]|uniref:BTB domain-containing protein n=1 Tax=Mytilinidion resinicola TaxID=574789 RepID=A0A6A6YEF2_9PEZI|nr:uncharacterized protein BDZ99DRAFT_501134 [Mytilinidion resinicola]KAF2806227.1 hypothetical protein BDZ99DRAFT_501134 [Mytilinidion resinicola]
MPPASQDRPSNAKATMASTLPAPKQKRSQLFDFSDTRTIMIKVGPDGHAFCVHIEPLCLHIEYFNIALNPSFAAKVYKGGMVLKDTTPETFQRVLRWVYADKYEPAPAPLDNGNEDDEKEKDRETKYEKIDTLVEMDSSDQQSDSIASREDHLDVLDMWIHGAIDDYCFAEKYGMPELKLCIMKAWQACALRMYEAKWVPDDSVLLKAYDKLCVQSPLRKHITSWFAYEYNFAVYETALSKFPRSLLEEVIKIISARLLSRFRGEIMAPWENWCDCHEHKNEYERHFCEGEQRREQIIQAAIAREEEDAQMCYEILSQKLPPLLTQPEFHPPEPSPQPHQGPPNDGSHQVSPEQADMPQKNGSRDEDESEVPI